MPRTVLQLLADMAPVVGLDVPTMVFSGTSRDAIEMQTLANACALSIATDYDWQALRATATLAGTGAKTAFDLPSDYDRMPSQGGLWSSATSAPLCRVLSDDQWLGDQVQNWTGAYGGSWIIQNGKVMVVPAMGATTTAKFVYQSSSLAIASTGTAKERFTADTDTFRLDGELLRLTMLWTWKAQKGLPYAEDMTNAERRKERLITSDRGSRTLASGPARAPLGASYAYPYPLGF